MSNLADAFGVEFDSLALPLRQLLDAGADGLVKVRRVLQTDGQDGRVELVVGGAAQMVGSFGMAGSLISDVKTELEGERVSDCQ